MVRIYRKNIFVWTLMVNWMAGHTLQTIVLDEITKINTFFSKFFLFYFCGNMMLSNCCIDLICNKYTKLYGTFKLKIYLKFVFVERWRNEKQCWSLIFVLFVEDWWCCSTAYMQPQPRQNSRAQILNDSLENQIIWHNYLYCTVTATMRYFE